MSLFGDPFEEGRGSLNNYLDTENKKKQSKNPEYKYYDDKGNYIGKGIVKQGDPDPVGKKVFKQSDGSYSTNNPAGNTSVRISAKTGKITVTAPSYVLEREGFKEGLDQTLATLSRYYKKDKNYAIPMSDGSKKTVEQFIEELNDPNNDRSLKKYVEAVDNMRKQEYGVQSGYEGDRKKYGISDDITLNDKYFTIRNAIALGDGVKDDTRQAISNLPELAFMRNLSSYDEETGTVAYKDLMENGWNRDKHSDEEIRAADAALKGYFANGDFSDTDELARNIATYEFMHGRDPDVAWFRNVFETTGALFEGAWNNFVDVGGYIIGGGTANIFGAVEDASEDLAHAVFGTEDNDASDKDGVKKMFNDIMDYWEDSKAARREERELVSDTQAGASSIGYAIARLVTLIAVGDVVKAGFLTVAGGLEASAAAGAAMAAEGITAGQLSATWALKHGFTTMIGILGASHSVAVANVISALTVSAPATTVIGLLGETFGESISANPKMFYEVMNQKNLSEEARAQLWEDFIGNSIGLGVGFTLGKGIMKVGQTTVGRAISHNMSRNLYKIQGGLNNIANSVRFKIHGVDNAQDYIGELLKKNKIKKADAYAIDEMIMQAKKAVANSDSVKIIGKTKQEIIDQLDDVRKDVTNMLNLENAVDEMRRRGRGIVSKWYTSGEYETFQGAAKNLDEAYEALRKAEKGVTKSADFRRLGSLAITQDSTNYIKGVSRLAVIDSMLAAAEKGASNIDVSGLKKEKELLEEAIANYKAKATPEMLAAANAFIDADRKWAMEANNLLMKEGLLSTSDIESMRASGIWGNNGELYTPLLREHHLENIHQQKVSFFSDSPVREAYKYSFGKNDDFLDPLAASRLYMSQFADKAARQDVVKAYQNISGVTNNELLTAAQTKAAKIAQDGTMEATKTELDVVTKDMAKDIRASGLVNDLVEQHQAHTELGRAVRNSNAADESLVKTTEKAVTDYKPTTQNMRAGTMAMGKDDVQKVWTEGAGEGVDVRTYVVENYSDLPRSTKAKLREKRDVMRFAKGEAIASDENTLQEFAMERASETLAAETGGYRTIHEWTESEDFANMTNAQRKKVLAKVYGEERADEIMKSASEYHQGNLEGGILQSNEERIAKYQQNKAEAKAKLEADIQKRRDKYAPFIARQKYNNAVVDYSKNVGKLPRRSKLVAQADELDPVRKTMKFQGDAKVDAENIDLALEVRQVKKLRNASRSASFKPTAQEKLLLAKWDGKKFPRFSPGTKRLVSRYDRLENMSDLPGDLKVAKQSGKATAEEFRAAIANAEYGSETSMLGDIEENMMKGYLSEDTMTEDLFDEMAKFDEDFVDNIQRDIIANDPKFNQLDDVQNAGRQYAYDNAVGRKAMRSAERSGELTEASAKSAAADEQVDTLIAQKGEEILDNVSKRKVTNRTFNRLAEYYGLDQETASRYFALRGMCDAQHKKFFRQQLFKQFKNELRQLKVKDPGDVLARKFTKQFEDYMQSEYDTMRVMLQDSAPELVDQHGIFTEVEEIAAKENLLKKQKETVVAIQNDMGEVSFVETDPLVAHLMNYTYVPKEMTAMQKANYLMSKFFRLGTTGIRITSIVNQTFRDFGNAFVGANVYRTWSKCVDEMRDVLGDDVVNWIEASDADMAEYIRKVAKETGENEADVAYSAIKGYGAAISPEATETAVYKNAGDIQQSVRLGKLRGPDALTQKGMNKTMAAIDKAEDKLGWFNGFRESGLRNASFRNAFTDAVKRGYSYSDAKIWATFAMNNATTNFGRATKMFSNLQDSVPFLGAAINGTKSFWRMFSVDPVGVMGRLMGGIILPTVALTSYSLHDKQNIEAWKNLNEYQKDDNLVFIVDGQILSIPLPQELSAIINPFRHLVEGMHGANRHSFWQLAINDMVGFSPIDLDGFVNIDAYTLSDGTSQSNFFVNNMLPGVSKMFSQLAPVPMKAAAMWITGIDPYTMKPIDRSYKVMDPDTGEAVVMNDYSGELGKFVASLFKDTPLAMSATMAEKLLGSIFGKAPVEYTGWLIELGQSVTSGSWESLGEGLSKTGQSIFETVTDPLYIEQYRSAAQADWKNFVSQMYTRKETLLNSDEWQDYMEKRRNAKTPEDLEKLKTVRSNLLNPYYEDLKKATENLKSQYGLDTFTADKYAAVISLSVMDQTGADISEYGQQQLDEVYQDAKTQAIHTMYEMGFDSPADYSAFGYITTDKEGNPYVNTSTPMAILDMRRSISSASDLHYANLNSLLKANSLDTSSQAYRDMSDEVDKIYSKKKLSNSDYKKINKIYKDWDVRVMEVIFPYIKEYGADSVLDNSSVSDLLDNVIKVPSDYEINKKGYYISAPRLNKQRGFAQSYIKYLYKKMGGR